MIKIYPVLNGTTILMKTERGKTIMVDCKVTRRNDDPEEQAFYDVKSDLMKELPTNSYGAPYIDLFVLSHPDDDHCHGFSNHFFTGAPNTYTRADRASQLIMINEIWSSKLIYGKVCADAKCIRDEIDRRRKFYSSSSRTNETDYNRVSMIGYDDDSTFTDCPFHMPGDIVTNFGGTEHPDIDIFIHGPFKKSLIQAEATDDRNVASIVAQYKFKSSNHDATLAVLEGGDADHYQWREIKEQTEKRSNGQYLEFNVFLAAHHCSWSFFNDRPYSANTQPVDSALEFLKSYALRHSFIISSSKEIVNNDDNPPHYPAKTEYMDAVAGRSVDFLCTGEYPTRANPQPIVIELTASGPKLRAGTNGSDKKAAPSRQRGFLLQNPGINSYGEG